MKIVLDNIGKRYIHQWIFRNVSMEFDPALHYGILGNNGSGKSTLLKIISGFLHPTEGSVSWHSESRVSADEIFRYIGIASPHLELIEDFSLHETLLFHQKFRQWLPGHDVKSIIQLSGLSKSKDKPLKYFSSGMKQRVKLLLAVMSQQEVVILDEPCSNLDERSVEWYRNLITDYTSNRLLIIGSNDQPTECFSCSRFLNLSTHTAKVAG